MLFLIALGVRVTAQTPEEFKQRYGNPRSGDYIIRDGIAASVKFDDKKQVSEIIIEAVHNRSSNAMSPATAGDVLDEVMPISRRGKLLKTSAFAASCVSVRAEEYENVTISRTIRCESQGGGLYRLTIRGKLDSTR